ncbi:uncharacterized protein zgc:113276 isoform X1 [Esox lucius]|uniref:Uncharacterized protein n=1 Tax=Esox lucius TaxID=8010 RepID=A0A3P8Y623_ESOLU|nr:uncharacterized protein zgc:113276 isoform X1 [Esox lucius]
MLDVLIIGAGPHALTLATLLSHPDQALSPASPSTDILHGVKLSRGRAQSSHLKNHKKGANRQQTVEREKQAETESEPETCPPLDFRVVDSYGAWTTLWENQFRALRIPHLRSHTLVHTDPLNKRALQEFVLEHDRTSELRSLPDQIYILDENAFFNDMRLGKKAKRRLSNSQGHHRSLYFSLPETRLSVDFFRQQVKKYNLDSVLIKGTVDRLIPVMSEGSVASFRALLQSGEVLEARRVVMATGPTRAQMANIPTWVSAITETYPEERMQHTVQLMHYHPATRSARQREQGSQDQEQEDSPSLLSGDYVVSEPGQRVLVVGGGLTSAHVISIALQQGASHVTWVMRKHLQLKQFDVGDVESLVGRYSHMEHGIKLDGLAYLRQFYNESSLHKRLAMIRQARKGGAVTPEAYAALQPYIQTGQLAIRAYCQVTEAKWCYKSQAWILSMCGQNGCESWTGDRIWLATGCKLDVNQDQMLSAVIKEYPIQVIDGWPCISETLQWAPGCPLYLMGQYTALQVGPHAVNLAGGQAAGTRIAKDVITQHNRRHSRDRVKEPTSERTQTEEYIEQMHGLMWL